MFIDWWEGYINEKGIFLTLVVYFLWFSGATKIKLKKLKFFLIHFK